MSNIEVNSFAGESGAAVKRAVEKAPDLMRPGVTARIGVLINPRSGGNRNGLAAIRNAIAENPQVFHCDAATPGDVSAALADFAGKEVNLVAINGGDGTVQAVLTALFQQPPFETPPLLAVLQSGTASMIARDVGFRGSRGKVLRRLFHWAQSGDGEPLILRRPVLRVQAPGHQTRYGMFFGAAGIYQGIQYCLNTVHPKGLRGEIAPGLTLMRYLWAVIRKNSDFVSAVPIQVKLDHHPPQELDCLVVIISTLERLFLGLYPFWGSESGPLHYTAVRARPRHLLRALPALVRGQKGPHGIPENGYFSHNLHEIRLKLDSGFTLDGQLYMPEVRNEPVVVQYGGTAAFLQLA
jgi:hypothetical protein